MDKVRATSRKTSGGAPDHPEPEPLVELAPDEAVIRALAQSAHPIEWAEAHKKSDQAS